MAWQSIPGRAAYLWIYDEWVRSAPRPGAVVVEVGVALGKSIAYLCEQLEQAGRDDVQVYAVDAWGRFARNGEQQVLGDDAGGDFSLYARTMLEHAPRAFERVRPLRTLSTRAADLFDVASVDLVLLDADHTLEAVRGDLRAWSTCVRTGPSGWIGGDDYHAIDFPGVVRAVDERFPLGVEVRRRGDYAGGDWDWPTWLKKGVW